MTQDEKINFYEEIDKKAVALQNGDVEIFPEIAEHYNPIIQKIVFSITHSHDDAEDVAQEVFVTVLEKIEQWHGQNFHGWILKIAKNYAIDCLRKRKRKNKYTMPRAEFYEDSRILLKEEEIATLNVLLSNLPVQQKEILYLKHFKEMSIRQIAEHRNCAEGTVKATLHQTILKLKTQFKKSGLLD